ncbi:uncharacterized protein LOC110516759 [Oncorhynchus mykiss]|uniref:uncharacterized protein LOC110516759 n=1 Tax=Oncorhynchus mykiss TaxID=8022 RepID=UPI000B4E9005|nr:uncharacterized protein LOC110516759 [Oncorhynchus mykiss]
MASKYITEIAISTTREMDQQLHDQDYDKINVNLNKGTSSTTRVYIWYKKGNGKPITRVQFSFTDEMKDVLKKAGFTELPENLNPGTQGDVIQLWYSSGASPKYDIPIEDLFLTTNEQEEAHQFKLGWERLPCNLNRSNSGDFITLWLKRKSKTYICDVAAATSFQQHINLFNEGYIRLDEDLSRGSGGKPIYLWYRQSTTVGGGITEMNACINREQDSIPEERGFTVVNVNLNEGTCGQPVYVWFKKDGSLPIKALTVTSNPDVTGPYDEAGLILIDKNLNAGNSGVPLYLWYGK